MTHSMTTYVASAVVGGLSLVVAACQPINPELCATTDWYQVGLKDGQNGRPDRLGSFAQTCGSVNVVPDANAYGAGRTRGLEQFCTFETGVDYGLSGRSNPVALCDVSVQSMVAQGWFFGDAIKNVEDDIDEAESQLDDVRSTLEDSTTPQDELERLWQEFDRLEREHERLRSYRQRLINSLANYRISISENPVLLPPAAG